MAELWLMWMSTVPCLSFAWCGGHFLLPRWHAVPWWWLWPGHCWETTRHLSPSICSKVYETCVCSAMLHRSETWGPNNPELQRPCHNDPAMICWICGTKDRDKTLYTLSPTITETWHWGYYVGPSLLVTQMVHIWPYIVGHVPYQIYHKLSDSQH